MDKPYEKPRKMGQNLKNWAIFESAFCQQKLEIGQNLSNIVPVRPKSRKLDLKLRQNAGVFDLVATDGDKGDPPTKTPRKRGDGDINLDIKSEVLTS